MEAFYFGFTAIGLISLLAYWFLAVSRLFKLLKHDHPQMFVELGSPALTGPQATPALLRFLGTRRPERLGDAQLLLLAQKMRIVITCYLVLFFALAVYLMAKA